MSSSRSPIVLFHPAPRGGWQPQRRVELPLGLLCCATPLDLAGYSVRIVDQFASPDWKQQLDAALVEKPLCFGVSSMTGPQLLRAVEFSRQVKTRYPDVPVVWGGVHGSLMPEQTLASPYVDVVVRGEGEETFPELVRAFEDDGALDEIAGLAFKRDGAVHLTAERPFVDLNAQPPLAYHLVNMDLYKRRLFGSDHVTINSSRGCVHRCKFCWDPVMHKRTWRAMQPEAVVDHIKRIVRDYGIRGFLFCDDNFFVDLKRARGILEGVVRSGLGISLGKLQVRADTLCRMDDDFLDLLVRAKVRRVMVGVESGSQRMLDFMGKGERVEHAIEANTKLARVPIVPLYLFMMGLPTETPDDLAQSIRLATRLTDDTPRAAKTFNIFTPYPGTELYEIAVEHGLERPQRIEDWATFNFRNVSDAAGWISPEMRKLIKGLDFLLMFLGTNFVGSYKKTNPLVATLARLYHPVARYRVTNLDARFPIETRLLQSLGLFARQD
ncbi:MAG: B12-binding domain-containing radical SAM protein [Deltaproteobacteria bacterium]|nr:B12-binding domain-containing radical SAM protein [Deltaproteobacteria bacterium]